MPKKSKKKLAQHTQKYDIRCMEKNAQVQKLKELKAQLEIANKTATELGATSKRATLVRMIDVINFDLFKLGDIPTGTPLK